MGQHFILVASHVNTSKPGRQKLHNSSLQHKAIAIKYLERKELNKNEQHKKLKNFMNRNLKSKLYL